MQQKVFISLSSKDAKIAQSICAALEARGHQCWMSSRDVKPGENYQGAIVRAIRDAGVMVMVFSTNANNSDEIKKELALASQSHVMVIPVRAEDVLPSEDFTYELATRQWIDLFDDWERAIEQLGHQIDHAIPRAAEARAAAAPARAAKNRVPLFAGVAAALLLAGAGAVWLMPSSLSPRPAPQAPQATAQPVAPAMDAAKLEDDLWDSVKDSGDAAALNSYLAKYPSGLFAAAAKAKLALLSKPAAPAPAPVKTAAPAPVKTAAKAAAPQVATAMPMSMPKSANAMPGQLNSNVQMAVDMARSAETRAREMAQNAEQSLRLVQAVTPGYGSETVHAAARWGGRLAILRTGGPAVITYGNGDRYAGGTRDGQRYGVGVFTGAPSKVFRERVGEFIADQMSGYGVVYRSDGRVRLGQWKGGVMDGYGAVYDAQGRLIEQGLYVNDKLAAPLTGN